MQLPLLNRTTQMALLKKLIRRKARELRHRRHRARHRLEMMRRIRKELLLQMRRSIDSRQRDAEEERREQARRAVGSMLHLYKGWLRNWSRALSTQSRLIRQQEQLKRQLQRRLKVLRKRLRKHRRPQHVIDRCFQKLGKAVKKWQQRPDYHTYIEDQERIWEQEAEEVRQYLADFRPSKRRRSRRARVSLDGDLQNFSSFWENEVLRKKKKLQKTESPSEGTRPDWEVYTIPKPTLMPLMISSRVRPRTNVIDLTYRQRRRKRRKLVRRETDPLGPSLIELKQLLAELLTYKPTDQKIRRGYRKHSMKLSRKSAEFDLYQQLEKAINSTKHPSMYLFRKHKKHLGKQINFNLNRLLDIGSVLKTKMESRVVLLKKAKKKHRRHARSHLQFHWPPNFRKNIPAKKLAGKSKFKFVDDVIKEELNALTKYSMIDQRHKASKSERKDLNVSSDILVPGLILRRIKKKRKMAKKPLESSPQPSDAGTQVMVGKLKKRIAQYELSPPKLKENSFISLNDSLNRIAMDSRPRKSGHKSIRGMSVDLALRPPVDYKKPQGKKSGVPAESLRPKNKLLGVSVSDSLLPRGSKKQGSTRKSVSDPLVSRPRRPQRVSHRNRSPSKVKSSDPVIRSSNLLQDRSSTRPHDSRNRLLIPIRAPLVVDIYQSDSDLFTGDQAQALKGDQKRRKTDDKVPSQVGDKYTNQAGYKLGNRFDPRISIRGSDERSSRVGNEASPGIGDGDKIGNQIDKKMASQPGDPNINKNLQRPGSVSGDQGASAHYKPLLEYDPLPDFDPIFESRAESRYDLESLVSKATWNQEKHTGDNEDSDDQDIDRISIPKLHRVRFLLEDLESDPKYKPVQYLIKDVIEKNDILDQVADVRALMKTVGKHYMWSNLSDLYKELMSGGIGKLDVKRLLSAKYLEYLKAIQTEQHLAKVGKPFASSLEAKSTDPRSSKDKHSKVDQLYGKHFWTRQRLSTRLIPFGIQGLPRDKGSMLSGRQDSQMGDSLMYKKLIEQELNVERLKRDERNRRLFPVVSRSISSTSTNTVWDVAPNEEQDLRDAEERYSLKNIKSMMEAHKARFQATERRRRLAEVRQKKLDVEAKLDEMRSVSLFKELVAEPIEKPLKQSSKKTRKPHLRPISQLYYSPRKTARQKKIILYHAEEKQEKALEEDDESEEEFYEKCPKCGVQVAVPPPMSPSSPPPKASSAILSSGSIEACAKSELLVNTIADVCTRCGYVHDEAETCSQLAEDPRKTILLRMIKAVQAVRSSQATQCPAFCSPRELRREKDSRSCTSQHQTPWSGVQSPEGGGRRCRDTRAPNQPAEANETFGLSAK